MISRDLASMSDRELFELISACAEEARRRSIDLNVDAALGGQYLSASERAVAAARALEYQKRQLHQAALAEAERQSSESIERATMERQAAQAAENERLRWARRKGIALAAQNLFTPDPNLQITIWVGPDGEKRVYVDHGYGGIKLATYYATGNRKNPPGTIETGNRKEHRLAFCQAIASNYGAMKLNVEAAANWDGEAVQIPGYTFPEGEP